MKILEIDNPGEIPPYFTGKVTYKSTSLCYGWVEYLCEGKLHREDGPAALLFGEARQWSLVGVAFSSKEKWFQALTPRQKEIAIWSPDFWNN